MGKGSSSWWHHADIEGSICLDLIDVRIHPPAFESGLSGRVALAADIDIASTAKDTPCADRIESNRIESIAPDPSLQFIDKTMPENWKETLFVWDGIFSVDEPPKEGDPSPFKWSGTWVGVDNADATKIEAPKRGAFDAQVESDMTFEVEGTATNTGDKDSDEFKASLTEGPGWDLQDDGADSKSKHSDTAHDLLLQQLRWLGSPDKTINLVFARGSNNFAPFISVGWMRPGNRITLGRRYLDEEDARAKWDLEDLKAAVLEEICKDTDGRDVVTPPWMCSVMHLDDQTGKRRKVEEKKEADAEEEKEED